MGLFVGKLDEFDQNLVEVVIGLLFMYTNIYK